MPLPNRLRRAVTRKTCSCSDRSRTSEPTGRVRGTCSNGGTAGAFVLVSLTESPDRRVQVLRAHENPLPPRTQVLCSGESGQGSIDHTDGVTVDTIENPPDLARLGPRISDALADTSSSHPTAACFHSLTALLQFVELPRAFRFLHTLGGRIAGAGARAHFHLDPDAHDDQAVATLRPLFDAVIDVGEVERSAPGSSEPIEVAEPPESDHDAWDRLMDDDP